MKILYIIVLLIIIPFFTYAQLEDSVYQSYDGRIGKNEIVLSVMKLKNQIYGIYHYQKHLSDLTLRGSLQNDTLNIFEYDKTGKVSGSFRLYFVSKDKLSGLWFNPDSSKKITVELSSIIDQESGEHVRSWLQGFKIDLVNWGIHVKERKLNRHDPSINETYGAVRLSDTIIVRINTTLNKILIPVMIENAYAISAFQSNDRYLFLIEGTAPSNLNIQGHCGAGGVEVHLILISLSRETKVDFVQSFTVESCLDGIMPEEIRLLSNSTLSVKCTSFDEDEEKIIIVFDSKKPDKGLQILSGSKERIEKCFSQYPERIY